MTKVFIAVNPSFHNKGDAAILSGAFKTLRALDNAEISLISYHPEYDSTQCDTKIKIVSALKHSRIARIIDSIFLRHPLPMLLGALWRTLLHRAFHLNIRGFTKKQVWEEYCESDIVIVGLNGTFTTLYGVAGFILNFYSIFLAKLLKKPVVVYAASIEPFKNKLFEILARFILNKADLITLREEQSYEYLRKIGVNKPPVHVTTDLAFLLQPAGPERVRETMSAEGISRNKAPLIGMTVSQGASYWAFPQLKNSEQRYSKYIEIMAQVVDYLVNEFHATIVFIPHSVSPYSEDRDVGTDIYDEVRNKHKVKVLINDYTAAEIKGIISQCDLLIGARTHSVIAAISMCIPSILMAGSVHKPGIMTEILDGGKWVYNETLDFNALISKINELWAERRKIKEDLKPKVESVKERALLNGELVKQLMDSLKVSR